MPQKILVVEDEEKIARLLCEYLQQNNYECQMLHAGDLVLNTFNSNAADLVILDIMLPGLDGISVCRELRKISDVPIIFLTAKVEEIDRILGLEIGADDYICKPFSPREVVARVKTILKRYQRVETQASQPIGELSLNPQSLMVVKGSHSIALTAVEFHLLKILFNSPGRIYSRAQLMEAMYADHRIVSERTIDSHIKKLRKKLREIDPERELIQSVYGVGYKFEAED